LGQTSTNLAIPLQNWSTSAYLPNHYKFGLHLSFEFFPICHDPAKMDSLVFLENPWGGCWWIV